ncbi:hypothetical protein K402DRAFT_154477 [Aulographum hederae CBS 113979]|uniref:PHD-type domain-containing protein n=1 Tax=Aulographum hederae CBS 113979 TaxID=1176131 RepID=A0A6G1GST4_9PEZI|nr:hypothetical protein K402DRAFT_154477 [Aulographum hederae CBS 113979]
MNVEQQIYGYPDWRLPSPSYTPDSATFKASLLRTPKLDCPSTHFLSAFSTPRPNGHQTPTQTPSYSSLQSASRPMSSHSRKAVKLEDPEFHIHHRIAATHLELPPVSPSRRLSSSPDVSSSISTSNASDSGSQWSSTLPKSEKLNMNPFQMQTPPPTRDSNANLRKRNSHGQLAVQNTASTIVSRGHPMGTPQQQQPFAMSNESPAFQTPFQYSNLQFTPEVFQFPSAGPATAPVYPQSKLFWDQPNNMHPMDVEMTASANTSFQSQPHSAGGIPNWQSYGASPDHLNMFNTNTATSNDSKQHTNMWPLQNVSPQHSTASYNQQIPYTASASGVNPNLLFSFSNPPMQDDSPTKPLAAPMPTSQNQRQPYEHQTRELIREKEMAKVARQQHSRSSTASSSTSTSLQGSFRPGLQRSNTDSGFRKSSKRQSLDSRLLSQALEQDHVPRRSSPLKRHSQHGQTSLSSIPELTRPRPRTRLVIDESGRARTETDPTEEKVSSATRSSRARHSMTWDDIGSDSETDIETTVTSRPTSFAFSQPDGKRRAIHSKIEGDEIGGLQRAPSASSLNSLSFNKPRTMSGNRKSFDNENRRFSFASFDSAAMDGMEELNFAETPQDNGSDAQIALKKVMEDRMKKQDQNNPQDVLRAHNQRWSLASAELAKLSSPTSVNGLPFYDPFTTTVNSYNNISPTAGGTNMDAITPTTDRSSRSNESTRCLCGLNEVDGGTMIQCESCKNWLHLRCVGFTEHSIPAVFVCRFCTQTPNVRPMRGAQMQMQQNFASPLNHKSTWRPS